MITKKTYRNYLIELKNMIFKVLPLYEEESETLNEYLSSLCDELYGLRNVIDDLPHGEWYVRTISTLEHINEEPLDYSNSKKLKKEVFKMLSLIDKQIDQLKGE